MLRKVKTLKEIYKTLAGAQKRCGFENGIAKGEFNRGDKARHYVYTVEKEGDAWRVVRNVRES